jgi:mannose-1-phosphate guanylyltransferase
MNILIMAGGAGTRLWPASRQTKPKQLLSFFDDKTLLQNTYERFLGFTKPGQIFIGTTKSYAAAVRRQLPGVPKRNFSIEPVMRDRGPAIGLAALIMEHYRPGSVFVTAWSDHHIEPTKKYVAALNKAEKYLRQRPTTTVQIGVKPTFPHTGFGYIQCGNKLPNRQGLNLRRVKSFKEKPDLATAKKFLAQKNYLWNTGIFMWQAGHLLELYKKHLPQVYKILMKIKPALGTPRQQTVINRLYPAMPNVDIEISMIEKLRGDLAVVAADFHWADVGSWKIVKDMQSKDDANISKGLHLDQGSRGSLVYNYAKDQFVGTLGLKNIVVVMTPEAILVADKDSSVELKQLLRKLKPNPKYKKFL